MRESGDAKARLTRTGQAVRAYAVNRRSSSGSVEETPTPSPFTTTIAGRLTISPDLTGLKQKDAADAAEAAMLKSHKGGLVLRKARAFAFKLNAWVLLEGRCQAVLSAEAIHRLQSVIEALLEGKGEKYMEVVIMDGFSPHAGEWVGGWVGRWVGGWVSR